MGQTIRSADTGTRRSLAFAVAAGSTGVCLRHTHELWSAAISLIVLGGITPMIYAVNVRILPVFSRRMWPHPRWLTAMLVARSSAVWLVFSVGHCRTTGRDRRAGPCTPRRHAVRGQRRPAVSLTAHDECLPAAALSRTGRDRPRSASTSPAWPRSICCQGYWLDS